MSESDPDFDILRLYDHKWHAATAQEGLHVNVFIFWIYKQISVSQHVFIRFDIKNDEPEITKKKFFVNCARNCLNSIAKRFSQNEYKKDEMVFGLKLFSLCVSNSEAGGEKF